MYRMSVAGILGTIGVTGEDGIEKNLGTLGNDVVELMLLLLKVSNDRFAMMELSDIRISI